METFPDLIPSGFEVKQAKNYRGNCAFFDLDAEGPSVQALEIIRHVDASFDMKKDRWDYFKIL